MFDKPTNVADTINKATNQYNNRQVDIDNFNSYTAELRLIAAISLRKRNQLTCSGDSIHE